MGVEAVNPTAPAKTGFNWNKASAADVEQVWPLLFPNIPASACTAAGQRMLIEQGHKGQSPDDILQAFADRADKAKKSIPADIAALSLVEVQDVLDRIGSRTDVTTAKFAGDNAWKANKILSVRLVKKGISLADAKLLEKPIAGARTSKILRLLPLDLANNEAPFGCPAEIAQLITKLQQADPAVKYGRSTNTVIPAVVITMPSVNGEHPILFTLGKDWLITKEQQTALAKANAPAELPVADSGVVVG